MYLYHVASAIKLLLGSIIMFFVYHFINVYEDPAIAIGLWCLGLFIALWWFSFFLFLWLQSVFRIVKRERLLKDSYKLSLLFGVWLMLNVGLFLLWKRSKRTFLLLVWVVVFQVFMLSRDGDSVNEMGDNSEIY